MANKFGLNPNVEVRDKIIFGEHNPDAYAGGCRFFDGLTLEALDALIRDNLIRLEERQNDGTSVRQMREFMNTFDGYKANGYAVTFDRNDYRVTLTGLDKPTQAATEGELAAFCELFQHADLFQTRGEMHCWFD